MGPAIFSFLSLPVLRLMFDNIVASVYNKDSLSSNQLLGVIIISLFGVWSLLLLGNIPLLSPFAWIGLPHWFLMIPLWWYVGNFFGIIGMFFIGALVRIWNEKQQKGGKSIDERMLKRGHRSKKNTEEPKNPSDQKDAARAMPKPIKLNFSGEDSKKDVSIGSKADFHRYSAKRERNTLLSLQPNRNYDLQHVDSYFDSHLTPQRQQPTRMQWTGQRVQEYFPSVYEEKPSRPEAGNYNSMEADDVLKELKIGEELYEWRAKMQEWLDRSMKRMGNLLSKAQTNRITTADDQKLAQYIILAVQRVFPSYSEYVIHRIKVLGNTGCRSREWNWNSGGDWNGKPWTVELPTDAELMMHVFCIDMDTKLSPGCTTRAFASKYFVEGRFDPTPSRPVELAIYQRKSSSGPHFDIIHSNEVKKIAEGRNNLFNALVIFIRLVKQEWSGCLDQIYLGNRNIDLLKVVS